MEEYLDPELVNRIEVVPTAEVLTKKPRNETRRQRGEAHQARLRVLREREIARQRVIPLLVFLIFFTFVAWMIYLSR